MTTSPLEALLELCRRDRRYRLPAYVFLSEAMDYAHRVLGLGAEKPSEPPPSQAAGPEAGAEKKPGPEHTQMPAPEPTTKLKKGPVAKPEGTLAAVCSAIGDHSQEIARPPCPPSPRS